MANVVYPHLPLELFLFGKALIQTQKQTGESKTRQFYPWKAKFCPDAGMLAQEACVYAKMHSGKSSAAGDLPA